MTGWMKKACLITVVLLMLAPAAFAASVAGTITAQDGSVLPGVTVSATHTASGKTTTTTSDADGGYRFEDLSAGTYRLTTSLDGFADQGLGLNLSADQNATEDFALDLGAMEVVLTVTAAKGERALSEIPQSVTVISASDIENRRPQSVQEAYERVPNMQSIEANPARSRPTFRGLSSSRLLLLLDGERINNSRIDANATGLSPGMIDVTQVSSIEVVGGAGSSLYGTDAHGGTINMITRAPVRPAEGSRFDLMLDGTYRENGDFDREYVGLSYGTDRWGLRAGLSRFDQKSYDAGDERIDRSEVVRLGEFSNLLAGNANTFTVWDLEAGGEVINGQGDGINGRFDLWYYLNDRHILRGTYLLSNHDELGASFNQLPFNNVNRFNEFRDFDKLTIRYEGLELASWLPRLAVRAYSQTFERPQNDVSFTVDVGSSYDVAADGSFFFTGDVSTFTSGGTNSRTLNDIESEGAEVQLNIAPTANTLLTTGLQYVKDESNDTFTRSVFNGGGTTTSSILGATTPDTEYENLGWFGQLEVRPVSWLRLSGGLRWDNWESTTRPTPGYPLPGGSELGFLGVALNQLPDRLTSFGFDLNGVGEFVDSVANGTTFSTDNDVWTGNLGLTFFLPNGINPYIRWGESYREPEVTVRYLVRNFGSAFFGVQSLPNPGLQPEEGESLDLGVKIDQRNWRASFAFFQNDIDNFIDGIVTPLQFFRPDPANGVLTPVGIFFQRVNRNAVTFEGYEAYFEGSFAVGNGRGSLTPYISLSWLEGENQDPTESEIDLINTFYNRNDTPFRLEGSPGNVPFGNAVPFQGTAALRYTAQSGRWWLEYEWKFADEIERVRPESVATGNITQFGILRSLEGYDRHSLRGGYELATEHPLKLTLGIENFTDELYFLPFQLAPAPGRSFVFGITYRFSRQN